MEVFLSTSYSVLQVVTDTVLVCSISLSPRRVKRLCVCMISTFLLWKNIQLYGKNQLALLDQHQHASTCHPMSPIQELGSGEVSKTACCHRACCFLTGVQDNEVALSSGMAPKDTGGMAQVSGFKCDKVPICIPVRLVVTILSQGSGMLLQLLQDRLGDS